MTKLEEVARALWEASRDLIPANAEIPHWDEVSVYARQRQMLLARAAIEALRTPTPEMYHAAVMTHVYENGGIEHSPDLSWKAMIDAILSEKE